MYATKKENEETIIVKESLGNVDYMVNDVINLLRVSDEDEEVEEDGDGVPNSHYIYIKNIAKLFKLCYTRKDPSKYCHFCNACVKCKDIREHVKESYKNKYRDGSILKLPTGKTFMKFKNFKNKLKRPFYAVLDCEACLVHQHVANSKANTNKLDKHVSNSCCFNFICTFDSSRNQLYTFRVLIV